MKVTNTKTFIGKADTIHNHKYNYSKTVWVSNKDKIIIICPTHGDFQQSPNNHLSGYGCSECAKIARSTSQAMSINSFIEKAINIHGYKYCYDSAIYKNSSTNITIACPEHGNFKMSPSNHTHKTNPQGCPTCGIIARKDSIGWTDSEWETAGLCSNYFKAFTLYVIHCSNEHESFFKIGKTFRNVSGRFSNSITMPYSWTSIKEITGPAKYICVMERQLHSQLKQFLYSPLLSFGGSRFECFDVSLDDISSLMEPLHEPHN